MKKVLLVLAALVLFASPALAISNDDSTGPEAPVIGPHGDVKDFFNIELTATNAPIGSQNDPGVIKDKYVQNYPLAEGWDFGDRNAYRCAWVEYFQGQNEKFELSYHLVSDYSNFAQTNDRWGREAEDGVGVADLCWENDRVPVVNPKTGEVRVNGFFADGTDHFPHMTHPGDGIDFYQNGEVIRHLELSTGSCELLYWVPGDEPGEAWLWWDEDGPTFAHGPGDGDLGCGGGPLEPIALWQLKVRNADPDIGWCTVSQHEQQCYNVEPPPTPVMFTEDGKFALTCMDGSTPAVESTEPLVVSC